MEVLVSVALLLVGGIIGFFIARHVYAGNQNNQAVAQAEQTLKEMLSQQAEHHIFQTRQTISAIEKQCENLKQQVNDYETVLSHSQDEAVPKMPFFGEQATSYLRNNVKSREQKVKSVADTQPRDFSNGPSGLFVGTNEQSTADSTKE